MSEKIKITDAELKSIRDIQSGFQQTKDQFGNLYIEKMAIEAAIKAVAEKENQLQSEWISFQKQENDIIESILKTYGEGSLDVKEGYFIKETPNTKSS